MQKLPFIAGVISILLLMAGSAFGSITTSLPQLNSSYFYIWGINGINLSGQQITSASLTFANLQDIDQDAGNMLYIELLNDVNNWHYASNGLGTYTYLDTKLVPQPGSNANVFTSSTGVYNTWSSNTQTIWSGGTTLLTQQNLPINSSPNPYTYVFSGDALAALNTYLQNGSFGIGFDPECTYAGNSIAFTFQLGPNNQTPVPEPATLILMGIGMVGIAGFGRRSINKARSEIGIIE